MHLTKPILILTQCVVIPLRGQKGHLDCQIHALACTTSHLLARHKILTETSPPVIRVNSIGREIRLSMLLPGLLVSYLALDHHPAVFPALSQSREQARLHSGVNLQNSFLYARGFISDCGDEE